jgi:hypothetical protein
MTLLTKMHADLARSGIGPESAERAGFAPLSAKEIRDRLAIKTSSDGYLIPYRDLDGRPVRDPATGKPAERVRLFDPDGGADGKHKRKYASALGASWTTYLPAGLDALLHDEGDTSLKTLVITEGEKKAYAGVLSDIPTAGLPGVSLWHDPLWNRDPDQKLDPAAKIEPALLALCRAAAEMGWSILVLADSDAETNQHVRHALRGLAQALRHQVCASVAYAACPAGGPDKKWGLDDWLVAAGAEKVREAIKRMAYDLVPMPRRVQIPSGVIPDLRIVDTKNQQVLKQAEPWIVAVNMVLVEGVPLADLSSAWEERFGKKEELSKEEWYTAKAYMRAYKNGGALHAYINWPIYGRAERNLWRVETWKNGVETKVLEASPAAWYDELVSVIESTDHLLPPDKRPLRLETSIVGLTDTGDVHKVLIPNDLISDKKAWRLAGFDGVSDAGLLAWQQLMAVGKSQIRRRIGVADKGWITLPDSKKQIYVYGQQLIDFEDKPSDDVVVFDGTGAAAQLAAGVREGGLAEYQYEYLTELFRASPALAGICGFAAVAPASAFIPQHETGILHIFGTSSGGKTTTLQLVASLLGVGASTGNPDSQIMSWRTTDNGLESPAEARRGSVLLIDELHMIPDLKMLSGALYMLANGEGKSRMKADTSMRMRKSWKTQVLSTGERSVEFALASADPRNRGQASVPGGLMFRVIDLAASRAGLIPSADRVPLLMHRYAQGADASRPEAVAHAIEAAVQRDFGHVWPELVHVVYEKRDSLPSMYAAAEDMVKSSPGFCPGPIISRRVKHAAGALVGLMLLLEAMEAAEETQAIILAQAQAWLATVLLPAGAEDLADGKAEAEAQYDKWSEALRRNLGRLDPVAPQSLGWRRGDGETSPKEICLHASAVSELAQLAGVEAKIIEDELKRRYAQDGATTRRPSRAAKGRKVWILPYADFDLYADGDAKPMAEKEDGEDSL